RDDREKEDEEDDCQTVQAREENQRNDQQAIGRIPVRAHVAPDSENLNGPPEARKSRAKPESRQSKTLDWQACVDGSARVCPHDAQSQAEGAACHQEWDKKQNHQGDERAEMDRGAEELRQPLLRS